MTTIVANRECMAADRFVTYTPSYNGDCKIWVARASIWGAAGPTWKGLAFKAWTLGKGKRPEFDGGEDGEEENEVKLEVLQLSEDGLFLWVNGDLPDPVSEPFYSIGSGAGYAIGALSMQASLEQSIEVAAKWDSGTRLPIDMIALADIRKKRKR